jgi:hypothetical protein
MEKLEMLAYLIVRFGLMALVVAVGAAMLYPLVNRWKWLKDPEPTWEDYCDETDCDDCLTRLFDCDGCGNTYDMKGSCEYRTYNEDGDKQDYLICQGCYHEIMDSWA